MRKNKSYLALILGLVILDQITKSIVAKTIGLYESRSVIRGFFNITRIHNKGAIFGFFSNSEKLPVFLLLTGGSFCALSFVIYFFIKTPSSEVFNKTALSLILAGALGNLTDRIFKGYVVDFLDFYIRSEHFPFFNVADSCITIGAILLIVNFFRRKPA